MTITVESSILARVTAAIQQTTFLHDAQITPVCRFDEDLDLDRLDVMEVLIQVEEAFGTQFPAEAILQFEGVPDVVRYLSGHVFAEAAEPAFARLP